MSLLLSLALLAAPSFAEPPRLMSVALEADDAAALCQPPACKLGDFWDRAKAMGVSAVVLREKPLRRLAERGEVLHVPREEFEKWRALGLVAPGAVLQPDTLWVKDPRVVEQVLEAVTRRGVAVSTSSQGAYVLVQFPEGYASVEDALGVYETSALEPLEGKGLLPVFVGRDEVDTPLGPVALRWRADGTPAGYAGAEPLSPADAMLRARSVSVQAPRAAFLRAAWGHPRRLLVVRLSVSLGRERSFELLRARLRELAERGPDATLPRTPPPPFEPAPWAWAARAGLWAIALLGGLLSARLGLLALKASRRRARRAAPLASPVLQLVCGLAAAVVVAQGFGWLARFCLDGLGRAIAPEGWARAVTLAPIVIGLLTLYRIDPEAWSRRLARPLTGRRALELMAAALALALVLQPRAILGAAGLLPWLHHLEDLAPWWAGLRWREALVGFPCLLHALFLVDWRLECPDCESLPPGPSGDPRTWFIPGLLGPAGVVVAAARGGETGWMSFSHSAAAAAAGALIGAAVIARRVAYVRHAHHQAEGPIKP